MCLILQRLPQSERGRERRGGAAVQQRTDAQAARARRRRSRGAHVVHTQGLGFS